MKLNIGAGNNKSKNYINCDIDPSTNPDYIFDLEKDKFPFENDSVEEVVAYHILEHLGEGYFHCIKEIYRVCKNNAIVHVRFPHHRHNNFYDDPTHKRPITVNGLTLFSKKYNQQCRENRYPDSCLGISLNVDFEIVENNYIFSEGYKQIFEGKSKKEIDQYIFEHNNIIQEVIVKLKVIKND